MKESQLLAVEAMLKHETGMLHVATAFGKTVVCCNDCEEKGEYADFTAILGIDRTVGKCYGNFFDHRRRTTRI